MPTTRNGRDHLSSVGIDDDLMNRLCIMLDDDTAIMLRHFIDRCDEESCNEGRHNAKGELARMTPSERTKELNKYR